jgi:hypothetical protein
MEIRPVGAELFHADGQTDVAELTESPFASLRTRLKRFKYELGSFS